MAKVRQGQGAEQGLDQPGLPFILGETRSGSIAGIVLRTRSMWSRWSAGLLCGPQDDLQASTATWPPLVAAHACLHTRRCNIWQLRPGCVCCGACLHVGITWRC